ncbi:MAG: hypothetical protein J3T61_05665 [Candidatus Brocadiales bacterium]|nr:hypothetical protein [Candidatus Bathyanammoxibius sp.]
MSVWQSLVELQPDNPWAHWRLAAAYGRLGMVEEAKKEIEIFNKTAPPADQIR